MNSFDKFEKDFNLESFFSDNDFEWSENRSHIILNECPHCGSKRNLFIDKKTKKWVCFSCVKTDDFSNKEGRGNLWTLFLSLGFDVQQVKEIYKRGRAFEYGGDFDFDTAPKKTQSAPENAPESFKMPSYYVDLDCTEQSMRLFPEAYNYLISRKVTKAAVIKKYKLKFDSLNKRIVFPAYDINWKCMGYQSRDITKRWQVNQPKCPNFKCELKFKFYFKGEEVAPKTCPSCQTELEEVYYPKSLNSRDFPKTKFFFNENNIDWNKDVAMVEGPFDCINVPNSIGLLGKVVTEEQFNILLKHLKGNLILYLDGDKPGTFSTVAAFNLLRPFFTIKIVYLEEGDDPGNHCLDDNTRQIDESIIPEEWFEKKEILFI